MEQREKMLRNVVLKPKIPKSHVQLAKWLANWPPDNWNP